MQARADVVPHALVHVWVCAGHHTVQLLLGEDAPVAVVCARVVEKKGISKSGKSCLFSKARQSTAGAHTTRGFRSMQMRGDGGYAPRVDLYVNAQLVNQLHDCRKCASHRGKESRRETSACIRQQQTSPLQTAQQGQGRHTASTAYPHSSWTAWACRP